jgi:hypothetical protein
MDTEFIKIGDYHLNLKHIIYIRRLKGGLRIVTTAVLKDGGSHSVTVTGEDAPKVIEAMRKFVNLQIGIKGELAD